jgi:hypothetical protein
MNAKSAPLKTYLETGSKRVFAGALEWPGWCRSGRDEPSALHALFEYRSRYERAMRGADTAFSAPEDDSVFIVVERLQGDATTDYGSPGRSPAADAQPMGQADVERSTAILRACWRTFDHAVKAAGTKELRKGPRGGGRTLREIILHELDADAAYLGKIGWEFKPDSKADPVERLRRMRAAILAGLTAAAEGKLPKTGPRGGPRWTARYFVRRIAWHVLDHAWEIEDRIP